MVREYEVMVVTRVDTPESELSKKFARWESIMTENGGELIKKDTWGTKKLAYPIQKQSRGVYTVYDVASTQDGVQELNRVLKLDESVLRCMTLKLSDSVDVEARRAELLHQAAEAARKAAEAMKERADMETVSARRHDDAHID